MVWDEGCGEWGHIVWSSPPREDNAPVTAELQVTMKRAGGAAVPALEDTSLDLPSGFEPDLLIHEEPIWETHCKVKKAAAK